MIRLLRLIPLPLPEILVGATALLLLIQA